MSDLIERLEKATGGDRDLDADIYEALGFQVKRAPVFNGRNHSRYWCFLQDSRWEAMESLTSSLDAALSLVEAKLPASKAFAPGSPSSSGWKITIYRGMTPTGERYATWGCNLRLHAQNGVEGQAPTPALAVLIALMKALTDGASHD